MSDDKKTPVAGTAPTASVEKPKEEPKKVEDKSAESKKEDKGTAKLSSKLDKIAKELEGLTVLEMSELATYLEEKFGVSAMPVAVAGAGVPAAGEAAAPAEEKTSYTVVLAGAGDNKLGVIKALREFRQDLGLMDAKKLVETAPQTVLENVKKPEAEEAKKKLEGAGAKVELK